MVLIMKKLLILFLLACSFAAKGQSLFCFNCTSAQVHERVTLYFPDQLMFTGFSYENAAMIMTYVGRQKSNPFKRVEYILNRGGDTCYGMTVTYPISV